MAMCRRCVSDNRQEVIIVVLRKCCRVPHTQGNVKAVCHGLVIMRTRKCSCITVPLESLTQFLASCASQTDAARTSQLCESPTVITNVHRDSDCKLGQLADAPDVIEMMAAVRTADLLCKVGCLMIRCEKSIVWPACYKDGCHSILSELTTTVCQVRPRERVL